MRAMGIQIEITSHYRLPARPERTREALKVFFPAQAEILLTQLQAGRPARVELADPEAAAHLVGALQAQGFLARLAG